MTKKVLTIIIITFLLIYSAWGSELVTTTETTPALGTIIVVTPPPPETVVPMSPAPEGNITALLKATPPPIWPIEKECYEKARRERGMTAEEAKRLCIVGEVAIAVPEATPMTPSPPVGINIEDPRMTECYKETLKEPGMISEEAERLCTVMSIEDTKRCIALENKLLILAEKISIASPEERKSLRMDMELVGRELKKCAVPITTSETQRAVTVPTAPTRDPCREVDRLKKALEKFGHKVKEIKILVDKDEITEGAALDYEDEMEHMKEKLRRAEKACQHSIEAISSLEDVERIYIGRLEASIEGIGDNEELMEELAKIQDEKRKLIEDFTRNIQELEFKKVRIIKKLRIEGGEISLDGVKVAVPKVKIEVEGAEMELMPKGAEVEIVEGTVSVRGMIKLEYSDGVLTAVESDRPIKVLPSELKEIVKGELGELELVDEDVPKYIVKSRERGKLLGLIPVTVTKESQVNAEDGKVILENKPWWSFLVFH